MKNVKENVKTKVKENARINVWQNLGYIVYITDVISNGCGSRIQNDVGENVRVNVMENVEINVRFTKPTTEQINKAMGLI